MTNRYDGAKATDVARALHDYLDTVDLSEGYVYEDHDAERGAVWLGVIGTAADLPTSVIDALPFGLPGDADVLLAEPIDEPTVTVFGFRYQRGGQTLYSVLGMAPDEATGPWARYVPEMGAPEVKVLFGSIEAEGSR